MTFTFNGDTFRLEFQRQHKQIPLVRDGRVKTVKSRFPYTTARLMKLFTETDADGKVTPRKTIFVEAEVGCAKMDKFSKEEGRKSALRLLCARLGLAKAPKDLNKLIWDTYLNRGIEVALPSSNLVH